LNYDFVKHERFEVMWKSSID